MRRQLMPLLGGRYRGAATVMKFGLNHELVRAAEPMMMLQDVALYVGSQIVVAQHIWTGVTPEVIAIDPRTRSRIAFNATVQEYYKFTLGGEERLDYCIGLLADIELIAGSSNGVILSRYLNNLRQSQAFARGQIEVPCPA
jgi:hypothetical protein